MALRAVRALTILPVCHVNDKKVSVKLLVPTIDDRLRQSCHQCLQFANVLDVCIFVYALPTVVRLVVGGHEDAGHDDGPKDGATLEEKVANHCYFVFSCSHLFLFFFVDRQRSLRF